MKWKRADGESAEAMREQVFLSRYKSELGIMESSVSIFCMLMLPVILLWLFSGPWWQKQYQ